MRKTEAEHKLRIVFDCSEEEGIELKLPLSVHVKLELGNASI